MAEHYTRNTVSAARFCRKCGKQTQHSVSAHKLGGCLECLARQTKDAQARRPRDEASKQGVLAF